MTLPPLHASEARTYQACPRRWKHAYIDRRVPLLKPEALTRGSSVHRWLNAWWAPNMTVDGRGTGSLLPEDPIARACCLGYAARYERPHLQDVEVELPFTAAIGGVRCAGTVDALGWEPGKPSEVKVGHIGAHPTDPTMVKVDLLLYPRSPSHMVIVEHKTTSSDISPGSSYWQQVSQTDLQVSLYAAAFPGATILYDVIRKPSLRKLRQGKETEETDDHLVARCLEDMSRFPDKYFQRQVIVRLEHEHAAFAADVTAIDALRRLHAFPPPQFHLKAPRNPSACMDYGRRCGYWDVCWGMESIDNDAVFTHNTHGEEVGDEVGNVGDGP